MQSENVDCLVLPKNRALHSNTSSNGHESGVKCMVPNSRMFLGESFEGETSDGQPVSESVKIIQELSSVSLYKRDEDNFLHTPAVLF